MTITAHPLLDGLTFDNRFVSELPGHTPVDPRPHQVTGAAYSLVDPAPTAQPHLIAVSSATASMLGLDRSLLGSEDFVAVMTGNRVPASAAPFAMNYGGHQFGHWAGQLGDGRAIALGEIMTPAGDHQTLQLKGAGPTPYARGADGRAVLRSSIREFLCSEAMHHLGVPTTRALSLALSGDRVVRDMFYDGNPEPEPGAVVCRVAPSFLRFGSFELLAARGEIELLSDLTNFTIRHHYPDLGEPGPSAYAGLFEAVLDRTIDMVVHWMRVGFVHGVMNTDNMSILGLTIDYGPYGWLDTYDPEWTPNTTDAQHRRYRFGYQPGVAQWNLMQLANALVPLVGDPQPLQAALDAFVPKYERAYRQMMFSKLGLRCGSPGVDDELVSDLLGLMNSAETDMTILFRALGDWDGSIASSHGDTPPVSVIAGALYAAPDPELGARWSAWLGRYSARVSPMWRHPQERRAAMHAVNPKYVFRNYLAQLVIDDAEAGDYGRLHELARVLESPYADQPEAEAYAAPRPAWARNRPGCSTLSCSS